MQITHWNAPKLEQVQITTLKCCIRMGAGATCNAGMLPKCRQVKISTLEILQNWGTCKLQHWTAKNAASARLQSWNTPPVFGTSAKYGARFMIQRNLRQKCKLVPE
jgi:hypothetical protein